MRKSPFARVLPENLSAGWRCTKRDGTLVSFDCGKIRKAIANCFATTYYDGSAPDTQEVAAQVEDVTSSAIMDLAARGLVQPTVEDIQRYVIKQLWKRDLFAAAESYQNYREEHRKQRDLETAAVFGTRTEFKPFEYPDAEQFKLAIQRSPWIVEEFDFTSDTQDFRVHLLPVERSAVSHTLLAISQVEVKVKRFWTNLGTRLRRPEFDQVGAVFGANEVVHQDAYSRILDVLALSDAFKGVTQVPAVKRRIDYLDKAIRSGSGGTDRGFAKALTTFALLVENVSLFSQFVVVKSFSKKKGVLQNVDNVVQATMSEEHVHASFGVWLVNLIKAERPEWFDGAFYDDLRATCHQAFEAETAILDWIFEEGDVSPVSRAGLAAFLQDRVNQGVTLIGSDPIFKVDQATLAETAWFTEELKAPIDVDFFHKRSTNYSTPNKAVTAADMW